MNKFNYLPRIFAGILRCKMSKMSVVLLVILLGACSKDSTPVGPDSLSYSPPKAGSTFRFYSYATDTTNSLPIEFSRDTTIHTFLQIGMNFAGKTNVSKISQTSRNHSDSTYLNFETNGDISIYSILGNGRTAWVTVPIGSKTTTSMVATDTITIVSGDSIRNKFSSEFSYIGTENLTINGKTLNVIKLKLTSIQSETKVGVTTTKTMDVFFYFAPTIGYYAKTDQPVQVPPWDDVKYEGNIEILLDYILK
ncbi:MAG: hypothetical protein IPM69_02475 [Ignavibacteria bacterium]|nr:hypothetical protein [Ignavibacteria bacterium]